MDFLYPFQEVISTDEHIVRRYEEEIEKLKEEQLQELENIKVAIKVRAGIQANGLLCRSRFWIKTGSDR